MTEKHEQNSTRFDVRLVLSIPNNFRFSIIIGKIRNTLLIFGEEHRKWSCDWETRTKRNRIAKKKMMKFSCCSLPTLLWLFWSFRSIGEARNRNFIVCWFFSFDDVVVLMIFFPSLLFFLPALFSFPVRVRNSRYAKGQLTSAAKKLVSTSERNGNENCFSFLSLINLYIFMEDNPKKEIAHKVITICRRNGGLTDKIASRRLSTLDI